MATPRNPAAASTLTPGDGTPQRLRARPHDWLIRRWGAGPQALLLHGAGGDSAGWQRLAADLPGLDCIAPDLPGQGGTRAGAPRFSLDDMATDLAALVQHQGWTPQLLIGHSAGTAIALRLSELLPDPPRAIIGINAALSPFQGVAGWLFPRLARAMTLSPFAAHAIARMARTPERAARLIRSTGSAPDARMVARYGMLLSDPGHVAATLRMMAAWRLEPLLKTLPQITPPVLLIAAAQDRAVPAEVSRHAASRLQNADYVELPALGHLAPEEDPAAVARAMQSFLNTHMPS